MPPDKLRHMNWTPQVRRENQTSGGAFGWFDRSSNLRRRANTQFWGLIMRRLPSRFVSSKHHAPIRHSRVFMSEIRDKRRRTDLDLFVLALIDSGISTPYELQKDAGLSPGATIPALQRLLEAGFVRQGKPVFVAAPTTGSLPLERSCSRVAGVSSSTTVPAATSTPIFASHC
jgi:hypothetical protein